MSQATSSYGSASSGEETGSGCMPIAIVGMGCRFPGDSTSPEKLWELLLNKKSARRETPPERFNIDAFHHPDSDKNGTMNNRGGHFLEGDIAAFDAPFFSISPAEALSMDPMQRILLEVVYEATENAGIPIATFAGSNTSCFVGCFTSDYDQLAKRDVELLPKYHSIGTGQSILSNRVSFCFDLKGPSVTIDTACSSSLVAVHLACQSLRTGESTAAIVGATNAILSPDIQVGMTNLHFLSPDSTCHTFDDRSNGYARGEGIAALVLKPLDLAVRDGDTIRAIIRGTAVNSNGKTPGITLPSRDAQVALIRSAYDQAGCDPCLTGYVEAHGTGTAAGDPIEAAAIGASLGIHRPEGEEGKLYVGSVKTNIGHLEGASGLAGMIKAVMSVERGVIAPNLWFEKGNPAIDFEGWRIRVPTEALPWPAVGLRRASVNGFGYGGTNGHVIIDDAYHYMRSHRINGKHLTHIQHGEVMSESLSDDGQLWSSGSSPSEVSEPSDEDATSDSCLKSHNVSATPLHSSLRSLEPLTKRERIFYLSAKESAAVGNMAKALAAQLSKGSDGHDELFLDNLAFTLCERRSVFDYGTAVVAATKTELVEKLELLPPPTRRSARPLKLGFVFTGQGAQWWAMGRELIHHPVFSNSLLACSKVVSDIAADWSLMDELLKDQKMSRINEAAISQPMCSALQIALVDLFASWGIHPSAVVGHSSGEIAAAYATGALSLEAAMRVAYFRGFLLPGIKEQGYKGGMMAAGISEQDALAEIAAMGDSHGRVVVGCVNSPRSVTLSGDSTAITQMQRILTSRGAFARKIQVDTAYHSHHMLAISESYRERLLGIEVTPLGRRKTVTMFSSVTGRAITADDKLSADYWVSNMVSTVRFSEALAQMCTLEAEEGVDMLIELGPHSALAGPVKQVLSSLSPAPASPIGYASALVRGIDADKSALEVAASLLAQGYSFNIHAAQQFATGDSRVVVGLPSYPWNHTRRYWAESRLSRDYRLRPFPRTDILGAPFHDWNPIEPRWRNFIRLSEQPWVRGHVIQGTILYPAAGFCCMAIEAALQMNVLAAKANRSLPSISTLKVQELSISKALVIPETEEGVEVIFSMRPCPTSSTASSTTRNEFRVFSCSNSSEWAEHCRGLVSVTYKDAGNTATSLLKGADTTAKECQAILQEARANCTSELDVSRLYKSLDAAGLTYGPDFLGIDRVALGRRQALGTVRVTDTKSGMPKQFEFDRMVHPATMDAFLQLCIVSLGAESVQGITHPYLPTFIQEVSISGNVSAEAGDEFEAAAHASAVGFREVRADVVAVSRHSPETSFIRMSGVKCLAIADSDMIPLDANILKHCSTVVWEPDVDLVEGEKLNSIIRAPVATAGPTRVKDLELLSYYFIDKALKLEAEVDAMLPHHQKFFRYMQHQRDLVLSNQHEQQTLEWTRLDDAVVSSRIQSLLAKLADPLDYEGRMICRMGQALPAVVRQEEEPLALMMEDNLLHDYYTVGLGTPQTYPQIARYVEILSHKYPDLDYLEIGAGTGGCTAPILESLSGHGNLKYPRLRSYTFTDISTGFFEQAAEKFGTWRDRMEFRKLDIDQDPSKQGFHNEQFDVVVAANVLHATHDIEQTMSHVRKLLRPGGRLILLDMTHSVASVSLIFGNLPGWWNTSEPWRQHGPLLSEDQWRSVLLRHGFSDLQASSPDSLNPLEEQTRVMIATAVVEAKTSDDPDALQAHTLLLQPTSPSQADNSLVQAVANELNDSGVLTLICTLSTLRGQEIAGKVVISFVELQDSLITDISQEHLDVLKVITQESAGVLWVTRGSATKGVKPEMSLFQGLARALRSENEVLPCLTLDLDAEIPVPAAEAAGLLLRLYKRTFGLDGVSPAVRDSELAEIGGVLYAKRVIDDARLNAHIATRTRPGFSLLPEPRDITQQRDRLLKLNIGTVGNIESLAFDDDHSLSEPLRPDEVEIEVRAVGLNFRDLLICMGEVADTYLGNECAGVVVQTGSDVHHVAAGDRVAAWCLGSFATRMRNPGCGVQRIPDGMSYATAAALPLVYVTAYYSLMHVARLERGESVLIHSAAGGVGQAAIQIAKLCGAEIYATVGTEEKKSLLMGKYGIPESHILPSHDLSFASVIQKMTDGRGVDVVLNSLAGDALQATWKCIAPFGRFVEIGKKDIDANGRLQMAPFAKNVTFTSVDATVILRQNRKLAGDIFTKVMDLARTGQVTEASPLMLRPFSETQDSMRLMQTGKHLGKIVLEPRLGDLVPVMPKLVEEISFPSDASYLLAGGLGGLGRSITRWMARRGARNFIFVSRHGASSQQASALLRELGAMGVNSAVLECDIADEAALSTALSGVLTSMPPLRGVIQGAMVLKDQIFANMPHETFASVIRPKVHGSRALHNATRNQRLDFFVLLSSAASIVGNAGQANYVAACTYQVALAAHRRAMGLPATAIDIGKVAGVGFVAENTGSISEKNLVTIGMQDIQEDELLAILEAAMLPNDHPGGVANGHIVTGVYPTSDPTRGAADLPFWSRNPVFSHLDFTRAHLAKSATGGKSRAAASQQPLPVRLPAASTLAEAEAIVLDDLLRKLSRSLLVPIEDMDAKRATSAYGVDSLVAVEVRNWFSREAKVTIPVFEILQAPTLAALAHKAATLSPLVSCDKLSSS